MENNKILIKSSFRGVSADIVKNLLILIINFLIYALCKYFQDSIYTKNHITDFLTYITDFGNISSILIIGIIFLMYIILAIISIASVIKLFKLFYQTARSTVIDFQSNRIISTTYSFPFIKYEDENKINEIINVVIAQGLFDKIFDTGHIYIEYLVFNKVDSQLRTMEIPYVFEPYNIKNKII